MSLVGFVLIKKPLSKVGHVPDVEILVEPLVFYSGKASVYAVTETYAAIDRAGIRAVRLCYWAGANPVVATRRATTWLPAGFRPDLGEASTTPNGGEPSRLYLRAGIGTTVLVVAAVLTLLLVLAL